MASTKPLIIDSLRGGLNNTDSAIALPDDQCTVAENVEWFNSTLGERRQGMTPIDLTGSGLAANTAVTFITRHLPTNDDADAEFWVWGASGTSSSILVRKDTTWHEVTVTDPIDLASGTQFHISSVSIHGKHFIAYKSNMNRLHVCDDGITLRRAGLIAPAGTPTFSNQGVGTFTGTRYVRIRWTVQNGSGVTLRRSEPSPVLTAAPSGTGASITITRPADDSESATHWEVEESTDNANFYRVSTVLIATTTYSDALAYVPGYSDFPLSEDITDYDLLGSAEFLAVDEDRLLCFGSYEDEALGSRFYWTPVYAAPGVGNDERFQASTAAFLDLDGFEGGKLTGGTNSINGVILATKRSHIYKLVRTGNRAQAYSAICLTKQRGALRGSLVEGLDEAGRPCVYGLDPHTGPWRFGAQGLQQAGSDIFSTWQTVNVDATTLVCHGLYYPAKSQVHWWVATEGSNAPNLRLVLHTDETRADGNGELRRGWALWTGTGSAALTACLFAANIDAGVARSFALVPFLAVQVGPQLIHRCDTGDDDAGDPYTFRVVTKPYALATILNQFGILAGALLAKAASGASVVLRAVRDFGVGEPLEISTDLTPAGDEELVIKTFDNLSFSELRTVQFEFRDPETDPQRFELYQLAIKPTGGQSS